MSKTSEFFDYYINPKTIIANKKKFKLFQKRVNELPEDYKNAMEGIQTYMFSNCGNEIVLMEIFSNILEMFEESVVEGKKVTDIVGKDLTVFCEELHKAYPESSWIERYKKKRQNKINKKFSKEMSKDE